MPAAPEPGAPNPKHRRRILLLATGVAVFGATGAIVYGVVQEAGEGRDTAGGEFALSSAAGHGVARDEAPAAPEKSVTRHEVASRDLAVAADGGGARSSRSGALAVGSESEPANPVAGASTSAPTGDAGVSAHPAMASGGAAALSAAAARGAALSGSAQDAGASPHPDAARGGPVPAQVVEGVDDNGFRAPAPARLEAAAKHGARPGADAGVRHGQKTTEARSERDPSERSAESRTAASRWAVLETISMRDEEQALDHVDRFVTNGGATLVGRVVDADGGRPVAGTLVHVHHDVALVEGHTDAAGGFRIAGMPPRGQVVVWVGRAGDPFIDERIEVNMPGEGQTAEAGTVRLVRGDELAVRAEGWVGVFVGRRGGQIVVSGVSPWLPADAAGVNVGDLISSIDGRDVGGLGPRAVTFLLRGRVGTPVTVVVRKGDGQKRKLTLTRVVR